MIRAQGLRKVFRSAGRWTDLLRPGRRRQEVVAVDGVDLEVGPGEIVGVMGANGAGKSTLLRLIAGLLVPDAGDLSVRGRVGLVLIDDRSFAPRLSGRSNLEFFAALHGVAPREAREQASGLLESVGLEGEGARLYREYSTGMRQRLALARGLLGQPEVLLLDEPTRGIDPAGALALRRLVRDDIVRARRSALVVATHDLTEARFLCDRVAVMERGRVVREGAPADVLEALGGP